MASAPTNVTATVTIVGGIATSIGLTWTNNGDGVGGAYGLITIWRNGGGYVGGLAGNSTSYSDASFSFDSSYYYMIIGSHGADDYDSANSNTVTPHQLLAPTMNSATAGTGQITIDWTNNGSPCDAIEVQRDSGGGFASIQVYTDPNREAHDDNTVSANTTYTYRIQASITGYGSANSGTDSATCWTATISDTLTLTGTVAAAGLLASVEVADILTLTDTVTATQTAAVTIADTLSLTDYVTAATVYNVSVADVLTLTDSVYATQTIRTNFGYYLAGQPGTIYHYDSAYLADNATPISCEWRSKRIDFADQDPESLGRWKTLFRLRLHYEDLSANTLLAMRVSVDGGATWTTQSATVGTGAGTIKEKDFFFIITGRMFNFSLISSSATNSSKVIAIEAEYETGGEYFSVS